jgi:L-rhamnonate dehydratase
MDRRDFLAGAASLAAASASAISWPSFAWSQEKSNLKITGIRLVETRPARPYPEFKPAPGAWSTNFVEVANPMSIYPEFKPSRSLFRAFDPPSFTVEVTTDKGIIGYGRGGPGGGPIVMGHLAKLMMGRDPFDIERNWDINWRSTMSYGRAGVTMNAISGFDNALWDIVGKALGSPIYELIGGEARDRAPIYCTGNDIEQHVEFGFTKLKLAMPHGPASGRQGMAENARLVERARKALGRDGEIMLDCWMAWTEDYTIEMAQMLEPYRVYWMEEVLQPHDYQGFGRLNEVIKSTRIVTGEHEYGRYGFRRLLEVNGAEIWQPDILWVGGMTELIKVGAMAAAYDIPVIPHGGGSNGAAQWSISHVNAPWVEMFMPAPGGPKEVYEMYKEDYEITRGPEGLYMHPPRKAGWGLDLQVVRVLS